MIAALLKHGQAEQILRSTLPALTTGLLHHLAGSSSSPATYYARRNFVPISSDGNRSLYVTNCEARRTTSPILMGLVNYFERHMPTVGFFKPIASEGYPGAEPHIDRHVALMNAAFKLKGSAESMQGVTLEEGRSLIAQGKTDQLLDVIYSRFAAYKEDHELVILEGNPLVGGKELDARISEALGSPVLLTMDGRPKYTAKEYVSEILGTKAAYNEQRAEVVACVLNKLPRMDHALLVDSIGRQLADAGLPCVGGLPMDSLLAGVRMDEVKAGLGAKQMWGTPEMLDKLFGSVNVASESLSELLLQLSSSVAQRPLVVTSADRTDIILGVLVGHTSGATPVSGMVVAQDQSRVGHILDKIFEGITERQADTSTGLVRAKLPVLVTSRSMHDTIRIIDNIEPSILPTSVQKIQQSEQLFENYIDGNALARLVTKTVDVRMTPKRFQYQIKSKCKQQPQHIVLPEGVDKRILQAAAEVTQRGLAHITILGDYDQIQAEANKLALDLSRCNILDHKNSPRLEKYISELCEARKKKGLLPEVARDMLMEVNYFATMMVYCGDADGMVSGAIHTTANTVRPALQVLRPTHDTVVSSVFFMLLPDKVLVYGDCAVNVDPNSEQLAQIALSSADSAAAFGIEPRVAMLSYSTLGSGGGPQVEKVTLATELARKARPDMKLEGPIQYDAAVDPKVAEVKIKTASEVAGRATVCIFPDLNTGNNTYKAVQQSTGAIAMGPVMQGLRKPVNDLSRGCTVQDIVNTVCATSLQAIYIKEQDNKVEQENNQTLSATG
eukprot:TRINITY_DN4825_c0_g2_i1.p1 TRINITY_DN4825_c0_g2~~TRINITY_DN4825_c0_g2_i1.p1  ORF type:complete len:785 (-),score=113.95 TRINITY_DN4825_c0_g2_i1:507-2861(-)